MLLKTKNLTETGARIVTVAVGERPRMEELEPISSDKQIIRCPLENLAKLGKMLLRGNSCQLLFNESKSAQQHSDKSTTNALRISILYPCLRKVTGYIRNVCYTTLIPGCDLIRVTTIDYESCNLLWPIPLQIIFSYILINIQFTKLTML